MLDELRRITWMPRSMYQRLRRLQEAEQKLSHSLGREPSVQELALELGWSTEAVEQVYAQMNCYSLISLESLLFAPAATNIDSAEELFPSDESVATPEESLEMEERKEILARAIEKLPEREKLILALYYKEELTLREIAQVLNITTARVSQIHARCIFNLREEMQKAGYLEK
jgi:RNA polymerase sigma factor for flagellar operon FliA